MKVFSFQFNMEYAVVHIKVSALTLDRAKDTALVRLNGHQCRKKMGNIISVMYKVRIEKQFSLVDHY